MGVNRADDSQTTARRQARSCDTCEVFNAILYLLRTGCAWRMLPHEFPSRGTVHYYYRKYRIDETWERIHDRLRKKVHSRQGKKTNAVCWYHRFANRKDD